MYPRPSQTLWLDMIGFVRFFGSTFRLMEWNGHAKTVTPSEPAGSCWAPLVLLQAVACKKSAKLCWTKRLPRCHGREAVGVGMEQRNEEILLHGQGTFTQLATSLLRECWAVKWKGVQLMLLTLRLGRYERWIHIGIYIYIMCENLWEVQQQISNVFSSHLPVSQKLKASGKSSWSRPHGCDLEIPRRPPQETAWSSKCCLLSLDGSRIVV